MIDKIKNKLDDLIDEIKGICEDENVNFSYEKKNDLLTQVRLDSNTIIRIYNTKSGLKIDDSIALDKTVSNKIIEKWKELYYKEVKNKNYTYKKIKDFSKIKESLLGLKENGFNVDDFKENKNSNEFYTTIADNETHEKVTVKFYTTGTIMIQGYTGNLWERVCRIIEQNSNCDVKDIFKRLSNEALNIDNSKKDNFSEYEIILKENLTETVYNFLSIEDREYLISSQKLIEDKVKFPRYNSILCTAALSIEGFFKTLIVKLKIAKNFEVANSKFNFGCLFDEQHKLLESKYRAINNSTNEVHKQEIKKTLEIIYTKIKAFRNPVCHSSGGVGNNSLNVRTFEKCKEIYEKDVIEFIKKSYYTVYK